MSVKQFIKQERLCVTKGLDKSGMLNHLMDLACSTGKEVPDRKRLGKEIFAREDLMSTGIGLGVAVPHVRLEGLKSPVICVGVQKEGIPDYESLDGQPVKAVFLILVARDQHKQYIRILSELSTKIFKAGLVTPLCGTESPEEIYRLIQEKVNA